MDELHRKMRLSACAFELMCACVYLFPSCISNWSERNRIYWLSLKTCIWSVDAKFSLIFWKNVAPMNIRWVFFPTNIFASFWNISNKQVIGMEFNMCPGFYKEREMGSTDKTSTWINTRSFDKSHFDWINNSNMVC